MNPEDEKLHTLDCWNIPDISGYEVTKSHMQTLLPRVTLNSVAGSKTMDSSFFLRSPRVFLRSIWMVIAAHMNTTPNEMCHKLEQF